MRTTGDLMINPPGRASFPGENAVYPRRKREFPPGRAFFPEAMQKSKIEWLFVGFTLVWAIALQKPIRKPFAGDVIGRLVEKRMENKSFSNKNGEVRVEPFRPQHGRRRKCRRGASRRVWEARTTAFQGVKTWSIPLRKPMRTDDSEAQASVVLMTFYGILSVRFPVERTKLRH